MKKLSLLISIAILLSLLLVPEISGRAASLLNQVPTESVPSATATSETKPPDSTPDTNPITEEPSPRPTRTPRPTGTPVPLPPPSDPETNSMLIGLGIIAALVVLFGVWINRSARI